MKRVLAQELHGKTQWSYLIAFAVVCTLSIAFVVPISKYRKAIAKYKFGMSMKEAQALMAKPYDVDISDPHYEGGPTERQKEEDKIYFITVQDEHVTLVFNHHKRLIEIWKSTWFTRLAHRFYLGPKPIRARPSNTSAVITNALTNSSEVR